jgi:guanylate cyclase
MTTPHRTSDGRLKRLAGRVSRLGSREDDDPAVQTRKTTLVLTTIIVSAIVVPWGIFYMWIGVPLAGAIPLVYATLSVIGVAHLAHTRDAKFLQYEQILLLLTLPVLVHIVLGGFINSSGVVMYSFVGVIGALSFATARPGMWFGGYTVLVLALLPLDSTLRSWAPDLPFGVVTALFAVNIASTGFIVFMSMSVYVRARDQIALELDNERARSDRLLLNVLPEAIANRLKDGEQPIADRYDEVAVLFADIVDFTPLSESLSADDLVEGLNRLFGVFDELALIQGVEKVKTIGDSYMVISGAPEPGADTQSLARLALDMREAAAAIRIGDREGIAMRFGMDVGPAVAGVIGESKFIYDVYGDTVNMASRMESHGEPNKIQITERVATSLTGRFDITERGLTDIKGKGAMRTFFLNGRTI